MKYWYIFAILYALSPIDLVPERFVGRLGLVDDFLLIGGLYWYFVLRPAFLKAHRPPPGGAGAKLDEEPRAEAPAGDRDPYEVLGLARGASAEEIKHAYRELANKYHPDKVSHLGKEFQEIAHRRFKEIQAAYDALAGK
ncbi:MAG: hypothetical protein A2X32_10055 [Elusimicrobia bacterium GWC2_64_44]|nr:MAG: hypothetical protein A2X32_10055 [Elusimicrobia bacterium GWC2_64_44]